VPRGGGATLRLTTAADAGHVLGCAVSATSHGMTTRVRTSFRLPSVPRPIVPPAILVPDGALQARDPVTCEVGKWTGDATGFAFRWIRIRDGQVLATTATYVMRLSDNGLNNVVACVVTATNDGGASKPSQSLNSVALDIPPTITILSGPGRPVEDSSTFGFFTFAIGGGGADTVAGTFDGAPVTCDRFGCQVDFLFNDGPNAIPHSFIATAVNAAGSTSTPAWSWSVNPPLPVVTSATGPADAATNPATFSLNETGGGTAGRVECKIDTGPFATCTGNGDPTVAVVDFGAPAGPDGDHHVIQIRSVNAAGASAPLSVEYTFLPTPALITSVDVDPQSGSSHQPFSAVVAVMGGAVHLTCVIDGRPAIKCDPGVQLPDPGAGTHTMQVTATNARGSFTAAPPFVFTYGP
jgi:hypothetical protein